MQAQEVVVAAIKINETLEERSMKEVERASRNNELVVKAIRKQEIVNVKRKKNVRMIFVVNVLKKLVILCFIHILSRKIGPYASITIET